jgi:hypothetical protein
MAGSAEAEAVMADEPLGEHPATLDEPGEEDSSAAPVAEVSVQAEAAEPAVEQADSSKDEAPVAEVSVQAEGVEPAAEQADSSKDEAPAAGEGGEEE